MRVRFSPSNDQRGFTLVEIVVAIAILAMILSVAYSALGQIGRSKRALDDARDVRVIANALLNRVAREFQLASPSHQLLPPPNSSVGEKSQFNQLLGETSQLNTGGRSDLITFVALEGGQYLPDGGMHSGAVQITYRVEENPESENSDPQERTYILVREETPVMRPLEEAYKRTMIFPVTDRLVSFELAYYNATEESWAEEWGKSGQTLLPSIVRFSVELLSPLGQVHRFTSAVPMKRQR